MKNREVFLKDPIENRLVNQGIAEVVDPGSEQELRTLRHELETFVCEGQYARGLDRILSIYLASLDREEQPAVWVSGFYGSGKSHLVKMLRFLWSDFRFPDDATARGLAHLPAEIQAQLRELSTQGKRLGGLHAAGGKLGAGAGESVRLPLLGIVFRSCGLPPDYASARFVLFLKKNGFLERVKKAVEASGRHFEAELNDLYVSPVLAKALLTVDPTFAASEKEVRAQIKAQFPRAADVSDAEMTTAIGEALGTNGKLPCTLIVIDEVQQFIGDSTDRAYRLQEVAEACSKRFGARILFVGTGQTAITGTPQLQKLQARFKLAVELSDTDVDTVVRKIILAKKPDKELAVRKLLEESSGEISRHHWAVMTGVPENHQPSDFKDFFWTQRPDEAGGNWLCFNEFDVDVDAGPTKVFYLHGGLHLYTLASKASAKRVAQPGQNLLDLFAEQAINEDIFAPTPLFVAEGAPDEKKRAILDSDYLSFCFRSFRRFSGRLVIFGQSLGQEDAHIVEAINANGPRDLAISILPGSPEEVIRQKAHYIGLFPQAPNRIRFFDATTHPLGNPALRA
jgi:hypothetical protein